MSFDLDKTSELSVMERCLYLGVCKKRLFCSNKFVAKFMLFYF